VNEGETAHLGWVTAHPGSREAEGEGGEGFYIARSGSKFVISGGAVAAGVLHHKPRL
jgi:hypothetical protein